MVRISYFRNFNLIFREESWFCKGNDRSTWNIEICLMAKIFSQFKRKSVPKLLDSIFSSFYIPVDITASNLIVKLQIEPQLLSKAVPFEIWSAMYLRLRNNIERCFGNIFLFLHYATRYNKKLSPQLWQNELCRFSKSTKDFHDCCVCVNGFAFIEQCHIKQVYFAFLFQQLSDFVE